jgi:peptide/nickel transport system ATP-binding protein
MRAIPRTDTDAESGGRRRRLEEIPGIVPALTRPIAGCPFSPRCAFVAARCRAERPPLEQPKAGHCVACWEMRRVLEAAA